MNLKTNLTSLFSAFVACLGLTTSGCFFEGTARVVGDDTTPVVVDEDPPVVVDEPPPADDVAAVTIDANAAMETDPGYGVGLYVQYAEGGHWNVYTSCDTAITGEACAFDVVISPEYGIDLFNVYAQELEDGDTVEFYDDGSLHLVVNTTYGLNGVSFQSEPGAMIEVDTFLDGAASPDVVFAVSRGEVRDGVPTNPVDFIPDLP